MPDRSRIIFIFLSIFVFITVTYLAISKIHLFTQTNSKQIAEQLSYPKIPTSVKPSDAYTIILVGDSMTQFYGENADEIRKNFASLYPKKTFGIFNYGFGSTNILSLQDRLEKPSQFLGKEYPAILEREFDLILIESMGNNPLSQFLLAEGLKKQTEALDKFVKSVTAKHPQAVIVFVATIAPIKNRYAEGVVVLSPEKRNEWANERIAYIQNHIKYAKDHNIMLINIFEKSLKNGDGNIDYINSNDFIHPSPTGLQFIEKEIADFIYNNRILPP